MSFLLRLSAAALFGVLVHVTASPAQAQVAEFEGLDETQVDQSLDFVIGNAVFIIMHELGHMLVSEFELPVLGREEDAVDSLSSLVMLEADDEVMDTALVDASDGWFMSGEALEKAGWEPALWGEHSIDDQRAYAIICMMVGHDPEQFGDLEAAQEMPESRRERCAGEFEQVSNSWNTLLEPHMRDDDGENDITVIYDEPATPDLAPYAAMFKGGDLLGLAKTLVADQFVLEDGITFRATSCGVENAFWSPSERTVIFCYEFSKFHAQLVGDYYRGGGK